MRDLIKHLLKGLLLGGVTLLIFSWLAEEVAEKEISHFDTAVTSFVTSFGSPLLTEVMKTLTILGTAPILIFIAVLTCFELYRQKHFQDALMVPIALAGGALLNELLKNIFHRPRPFGHRLVEATGFSFPSGHAMISAAFYGFLAYLVWLNLKESRLRYPATAIIVLGIFAIGVSRIYLGVHYPSDVIAGFAAGAFWLAGCSLGLQTVRYFKAR